MSERSLKNRTVVIVGLLIVGLVLLHTVSHGEKVLPHRALQGFPGVLGEWQSEDIPLGQAIVEAAGVNDYVNRVYTNPQGSVIGLYVGYYYSQRTGDTIHSPKNCLPGSGWEPVHAGRLTIQLPGRAPIVVNEYVVEKGMDREIVLYWYHGRGRVVASEYWGKVYMVIDAITRNRTDGALVRLFTEARNGQEGAQDLLVKFVQAMYPHLDQFVPN